jgi:hypothetical protein
MRALAGYYVIVGFELQILASHNRFPGRLVASLEANFPPSFRARTLSKKP